MRATGMMANQPAPKTNLTPLLIAVIAVCIVAAIALTLLGRSGAPVAAPDEQLSLLIERIPVEAQNALRGELGSFDALGKSLARLSSTTSGGLGSKLEPNLGKLTAAAASVSQARPAVETIGVANQETRELAPKLLSELGDLASAVGVQKLEGMSRYLERFELTVQRIQQELAGLASGVSDAGPTAQRLADSLEFLNQVMRGLSGEESGLSLTRVTGADAEQRLKTVVQRNQQFGASVRKAIGAAEPLSRAQTAARTLPAVASSLAAELGGAPAARPDAGGNYQPWIVSLLALAAALLAGLVWAYRKSVN